jgi:phage shock protein A
LVEGLLSGSSRKNIVEEDAMSFFERFRTTLRADANGLIDAIEEPTLMLKQHLRDAELAVQHKQSQLTQLEAEAKRLGTERQRTEADRARLERDAELALAKDREDLARYALRLLLPKLRLTERIDARLVAISEERQALQTKLEAQAVALEELRGRVQAYIAGSEAGSFESGLEPVTDEQIEIELLRRKAAKGTTSERAAAEPDVGGSR